MIDNILKAAFKLKDDVEEMCDKVVKKLDTRKEIPDHKSLVGKVFEVAVPLYKNTPGEVYADESKEDKYPARTMDRESHLEQGAKVRVVHAGPAMLFVEDASS